MIALEMIRKVLGEFMKKIISLILCLLIAFLAMPINTFALSINDRQTDDILYEGQRAEKKDSDFSSYTLDNVVGFKKYLKTINIDINTPEGFTYVDNNISSLYNAALTSDYITYYPNDILLGDGNVEVMGVQQNTNTRWSSGGTFGEINTSTHQIITKDALDAVQSYFPGFYVKTSSGAYITQIYAEYPDTYEKGPLGLFSWHFYNYETGKNYLANYIDDKTAKSLFFEHYNNAKNYYETNYVYALRELGAAIHYLEDLGTPVHVGDGLSDIPWWIGLLMAATNPIAVFAIYCGDMVTKHTEFESYVDNIDQTPSCAIPSYINYDYYINNSLEYIVNALIENSYSYYDKARGNDNEKYVAAINTVPFTKKTVAGVLYKFASEMSGASQYDYDGIFIRNKASNNYFTQSGTNLQLEAFNASDNQRFTMWEYTYSNSLNHCNKIVKTSNTSYLASVAGDSNNANVYLTTTANDNLQQFKPEFISTSGSYKLLTGVSGYEKVVSSSTTTASVGDNICQKEYADETSYQWYFDLMKSFNLDRTTSNLKSPYIKKGQWIYYKVQISTPHYYRIETYSPYDTYIEVLDSTFNQVGTPSSYDDAGNDRNARAYCYLNSGTYYVKLRMYSTSVEGKVNIVFVATDTSNVASISLGSHSVALSAGSTKYYKFVPNLKGNTVITTEGSYDTYLFLCDENMNVITTDDDSGTGNNAYIRRGLRNNKTYYIGVRFYGSSTSGTFTLTISEQTLPEPPIILNEPELMNKAEK